MNQLSSILGISGVLDIILIALFVYLILAGLKNTRAAFVLTGILIFAGIYLTVYQFNLVMTTAIFERFFAVIIISLIIIFQEEIRRFFESVAVWSLNRRLLRKGPPRLLREEVDILVSTLADLAREKTGALVVIRGKDMLVRGVRGGTVLKGRLSEPLLKSLFDPNSIGHDGAVIIEGDTVDRFSCQLPLSGNFKKLARSGTRHAAALGLSEITDALCLVVSEERGTISLARHGNLEAVDSAGTLASRIEDFYSAVYPKRSRGLLERFIIENWREKIIAACLSLVLWFVLVHGARTVYRPCEIPVKNVQLPRGFQVTGILPPKVTVTLKGPARSFYFFKPERIKALLRPDTAIGKQHVPIPASSIETPKMLTVEDVQPQEVIFTIVKN